MADLQKLIDMKIITYGKVYVINWVLESELKVWANGEDEAIDIFNTFHKPKAFDVFSIDELENNVVRFAI